MAERSPRESTSPAPTGPSRRGFLKYALGTAGGLAVNAYAKRAEAKPPNTTSADTPRDLHVENRDLEEMMQFEHLSNEMWAFEKKLGDKENRTCKEQDLAREAFLKMFEMKIPIILSLAEQLDVKETQCSLIVGDDHFRKLFQSHGYKLWLIGL
ncbi:twin-arginine translocation signal domain-containing protein, partial [Candidatus Uhrbacteria bacterium]|nr:twin-arginine translocation signal domain-containing protein [Candidatus Uhrbacteria bacterium]